MTRLSRKHARKPQIHNAPERTPSHHYCTGHDELLKVAGVTEVYSVAGDYDLVAIVRVKEAEDLAGVVTEQFAKVKGITRTMTLIAFKCYSNYDLEHMFQIRFKG